MSTKTTHGSSKTKRKTTKQRGIERLRDGRWRVRVYATDPRSGVAKEVTRTLQAALTKAEVLAEMARLKAELLADAPPEPKERVRLKDCAERWLEDASERNKRSTAEFYLDVLERRVVPQLGEIFIDALDRQAVGRWIRWAERQRKEDGEPYARDTLRGWWRVFVQFVRDTCADRGLPDPIVRLRPPKGRGGRAREQHTLSAEALGQVLRAAEKGRRCGTRRSTSWR